MNLHAQQIRCKTVAVACCFTTAICLDSFCFEHVHRILAVATIGFASLHMLPGGGVMLITRADVAAGSARCNELQWH